MSCNMDLTRFPRHLESIGRGRNDVKRGERLDDRRPTCQLFDQKYARCRQEKRTHCFETTKTLAIVGGFEFDEAHGEQSEMWYVSR